MKWKNLFTKFAAAAAAAVDDDDDLAQITLAAVAKTRAPL
mgnify:CR=1 FL=1